MQSLLSERLDIIRHTSLKGFLFCCFVHFFFLNDTQKIYIYLPIMLCLENVKGLPCVVAIHKCILYTHNTEKMLY